MTTFGIIGAGNIGSQVARAVIGLGHDVVIANSRGPQTLGDLVAELGPRARAATAHDAAQAADVAVVTVPLRAIGDIPVEPLAGKIVLDTDNYYFAGLRELSEGDRVTFDVADGERGPQPTSKVVKAFNHIMAAQITTDGTPAGTPGRRALATSSDHPEAVAFVTDLYDALGFDTVDVSPLSESWRVERDRPAYVVRQDRDELVANLARAPRTI